MKHLISTLVATCVLATSVSNAKTLMHTYINNDSDHTLQVTLSYYKELESKYTHVKDENITLNPHTEHVIIENAIGYPEANARTSFGVSKVVDDYTSQTYLPDTFFANNWPSLTCMSAADNNNKAQDTTENNEMVLKLGKLGDLNCSASPFTMRAA